MRLAVIAITRQGAQLGRKLQEGLQRTELHVSNRYAGQSGPCRILFEPGDLKPLVADLWQRMDGLIFIMASGIVVRMIAPHLESKESDPAVVVLDDAAQFSISLLSGHLGGANELAERCAFLSGARPVITTATDANNLPSFDMLAKEQGWVIDDISRVKTLNALLLDGEEIAVVDSSGATRSWFHGRGKLTFHDTFAKAMNSLARGIIFVTNRHIPPQTRPDNLLILRPRNLVLGIGCNRSTPSDEIEACVTTHLRHILLSPKSVHCIATADAKKDEPGLAAYAALLGVPLKFYTSDELNMIEIPSPSSPHALAAIGAQGVAEPAALLASGGGRLLLKKIKSANVTLAVAELCEGHHV